MANTIQPVFSAPAALTITLASLATSTAGVGRQSTLVDNHTTPYSRIHIFPKVTTGTSPTANKLIYFYLIKGDGTIRTDGAGASDAAWTRVGARLLGWVVVSAVSDVAYTPDDPCFTIEDPGYEWGIGVVHDTAVNLNATGGNHAIRWVGENPQVQ